MERPQAKTGRPDEETFAFPGSWRRVIHPRRGGIARPPAAAGEDSVAEVRRWTHEARGYIAAALDHPESDAELVKEARAYLDGLGTPRGAALVAQLVETRGRRDPATFADAWFAAHGPDFAAQAAAELCEVHLDWIAGAPRSQPVRLAYRPAGMPLGWHWHWLPAVERLRALLVTLGDGEYRAVAETLAGHRHSTAQRLVVSYLVPTEQDWVDECCANPPGDGHEDASARTLLFCALGSADQVAALGPRAKFGWGQWSLDVLATAAEGIGTRIAPMLLDALDVDSGSGPRTLVLGVLSRLPTDEAFQIMVDRVEQKYVQPALLEAMGRYPVRALRLLARAAGGSSKSATSAGRLLTGHLLAEPELTAAVLPELPEDVRAVVEEISAGFVRIDEAPIASLPRPLADPPWTRRRKAPKPVVVAGLRPPEEPSISWASGEREEWAATRYTRWNVEDWDAAVRQYRSTTTRSRYQEAGLFVEGPEELVRPLVAGWRPRYSWDAENWMRPVLAKYELEALDAAVGIAAANPAVAGALLLPFADIRVARLMADWLVRLKSARKTALGWFGRHGDEAARLLVPDALGATGTGRTAAEAALRLVASARDTAAVVRAARTYGDEAATAVASLLASDPLDRVPARVPKLGAWADPVLLPQVLLRDRTRALPLAAAGHVLTMLAVSKPGEVYAGLDVVREVCDPESLAEFGWAVFERWRMSGGPSKDGWALTALGWIGDDETVRRLTPVIRAWPGEGGHRRAVAGLDVLAEIGTEIALMHLNGIAQRVKFKALKERAGEKIQEVADGLGLSPEQLADRLVPDFGLDENGSLVLDYGPRRFAVGFDERLKAYVADGDGRRRASLPAPGARDDQDKAPAARKRFADLKKDVRTVGGDVIRRLEAAMLAQRAWSAAEFTDLFVRHPLTWHVARRLVWVSEETEFRVAEDRTFADVEDEALTLPAGARVHVAHPLELTGTLDAWAEVFADYEILQPFPQLGRPVYALTDEERAGSRLGRFEGITVPTGKLLGMQRHGWARGAPQDAGVECWFSRQIGPDRFVVLDLDPGIAVGYVEEFSEQRLDAVRLDSSPDDHWRRRQTSLRFGELDPVTASEVLADLTEMTS